MILIGGGHTKNTPGIKSDSQTEFDICKRISISLQEVLSRNQIGAAIVPFDMQVKERLEWIKEHGYNKKENIYIELHLSNNQYAHVVAKKADDELKKLLLEYFDKEGEIDVEEIDISPKAFEVLSKLNTKSYIVEAGNIVDYVFDEDFTCTAEAIAHAIADYSNVPYSSSKYNEPLQDLPLNSNFTDMQAFPRPTPHSPMMDPNTRREMIKKLYQIVLGRTADTNGIAYYMVHMEENEDKIMRDMIESTEHLDMVNKAHSTEKLEQELHDLQLRVVKLEKEVEEKNAMIQNYERISQEKQMYNNTVPQYFQEPYPYPDTPQNQPVQQTFSNFPQMPMMDTTKKKGGISGFFRSVMGK